MSSNNLNLKNPIDPAYVFDFRKTDSQDREQFETFFRDSEQIKIKVFNIGGSPPMTLKTFPKSINGWKVFNNYMYQWKGTKYLTAVKKMRDRKDYLIRRADTEGNIPANIDFFLSKLILYYPENTEKGFKELNKSEVITFTKMVEAAKTVFLHYNCQEAVQWLETHWIPACQKHLKINEIRH